MRWLLLLLPTAALATKNVFVSSPFDNFRIECPKKAAATELSIRMVESVGAKRQDVIFDLSCESVDELYPWINIPVGISDIEREDCYYSSMFDPILDDKTDMSCKRREYLAGITRLTDTRIQIMCCRLRSREEFNCQNMMFNKPLGLTRSTIIEHENQLINSLRIDTGGYSVRFCDLSPRNIPDIYNDVKSTKTHKTTPKPNIKPNKLLNMPFVPLAVDSTEPITKNIFANASRAAIVKIPQFTIAEGTVHTTTNAITPITTSTPTTFIPKTHIVPTISEQPSMLSEPDETDITLPSIRGGFTRHAPEYNLTQNLEKATVKHSVQPKLNIEIITLPNKTAGEENLVISHVVSETPSATDNDYSIDDSNSSPSKIADIIKQIQHASSESSADEIFKHTVTTLLQKEGVQNKMATLKPLQNIPSVFTPANGPNEIDVATDKLSQNESKINEDNLSTKTTQQPKEVRNTMEDITMVSDLSRITFPNEDFPKADERKSYLSGKPKISKSDLPLRSGASRSPHSSDFLFLKPINSEGQRRAPIRTHRPHVDIWSSEEDDMEALYGLVEFATEDPPTTTRKLTKLRRKVTRAHRLPVTEKTITTVPNINTIEDKETSANNIITTSLVITTSPNNALTIENGHVPEIMVTETNRAEITTTPSARRDLPSSRNFSKSFVDQQDNARFVDEETNISPFEDKTEEMNSHMTNVASEQRSLISGKPQLDFQEDEDIEEVIMKLSARIPDVRRSPVKNTHPAEQMSEKSQSTEETGKRDASSRAAKKISGKIKRKDGSKTHISKSEEPLMLPEMTVFEKLHKEYNVVEEISNFEKKVEKNKVKKIKHSNSGEHLVPMKSKSFVGEPILTTTEVSSSSMLSTVSASEATTIEHSKKEIRTTEYDPSSFYHTPKPKPVKKEKILTFCTKDIAIRDEHNMVIACGGEQDVWVPNRCPSGTDCFLSHDSTYRICCPVSKG